MVRDLVLDAQATEPAVRQIDLNLRTNPSLRPDRKDVADEQHSDHQFRVDRGSSGVCRTAKLLVDPAKIEHGINPPYHVIGWNHFIEMEFVEELPVTRCQPTHHVLPPTLIASALPNTLRRPHQWSSATQSRPKADVQCKALSVMPFQSR